MSNSMFNDSRVKGIILNKGNRKRYLELLSKKELQDVVTILYDDAINLGYNWNDPDVKCYKRSKFAQLLHKFTILKNKKILRW